MGADRIVKVNWTAFDLEVHNLAGRWAGKDVTGVWGIPQGGACVAVAVANVLGVPVLDKPDASGLVVDDLVDTGATMERYAIGHRHDALYRKPHSPAHLAPHAFEIDGWVAFPWERDSGAPTDAVVRLLEFVGEDPGRPGLVDTPRRVVAAYQELTAGYGQDPAGILATTFDETCDEMVVLSGIEFVSLCEHHLLPFTGTATVGYVPDGQVVGISKLARLVECYARRLQVQERLTGQIADAIAKHLAPLGVGVVVRARHACMGCRGVRQPGAAMVTSAMLGALRDKPEARAEFLALARS